MSTQLPWEATAPLPAEPDNPRMVPATFEQQRLWFLDQLQPGGTAYLVNWSIPLKGDLDTEALERTVNELVRRHEIFRTVFASVEGRVMQVIAPWQPVAMPVEEVADKAEAGRIVLEQAGLPVDLATGPMLRVKLLRLGQKEHLLLITMHHISFDGSSRAILTREFEALYAAFRQGKPSPLPEPQLQYADFAVWQHRALSGKRYQKLLAFWKKHLEGAAVSLALPTDRPRPAVETFRGAIKNFTFTKDLSQGLGALSRRNRASLFMTLLAGFDCLLSKYSGQDDIVVGVPVAGRTREELEGIIGLFANGLAMRLKLSGDPSFTELLSRMRETALDAYEHQDMPFEKLVQEVNPDRSLSHNPLFQVLFSVRNYAREVFQLEGLNEVDISATAATTSKFDLSLYFTESAEGLSGWMEYNTDLFDESTIERMLGHYQVLLKAVVEDPGKLLSELPLLTAEELRTVVLDFNDTQQSVPDKCLQELFEDQVERTPEAPALIFEARQLTYRQLNARANRLAHRLRKLGVGPEVLVAVCAERSIEMVVALLGILKAGGAYVPFDPDYPRERLAVMLEDAEPGVVLTLERLTGVLPPHAYPTIYLDRDSLDDEPAENPAAGTDGKNAAYVIYTSGSTGKPKGVPNVHEGIVNRLLWMQAAYALNGSDRVLQKTPYSFDVSVWEFFWPLITGACLVVARPDGHKDPDYLVDLVVAQGITTMHFVPSMLRIFIEAEGVGRCTSVRRVICSGEALPFDLQQRFFERLSAELHNLYGPTEASVDVTYYHCTTESGRSIVPIGKPIWNTQIYILDRYLRPVPIGVPGELHIGGVGLARGYLKRPELTEEKFIPDPFAKHAGARLYKSGDLARFLPDGNIEYLGRLDFQVKLRGFRIELGEIEAALLQHPAVRQSVVLAREDEPGMHRLVAYLLADPSYAGAEKEDSQLTETQVAQWAVAFNEAYRSGSDAGEATFNIAGWNSSYTGGPIPPEEMRVWVETTVDRIRALHPARAWEIGCGTGLLLFRVAPYCTQYYATDISQTALDFLRGQLNRQNLPQVTLAREPAHNFDLAGASGIDVVIINSVIQYFPDVDYLREVLAAAVTAVRPGGAVFVGDVRSLPLLRMFHASVQLHKAADKRTRDELLRGVERDTGQEGELVVDPEFFLALKKHLPQISRVEIQLKRGWMHNELTRFRYDVVLHTGEAAVQEQDALWLGWTDLQELHRTLRDSQPDLIGVTRVPNARVWRDAMALRSLETGQGPGTAGELREAWKDLPANAMEPETFWNLAKEFGYQAEIRATQDAGQGCFDVLLRRGNGVVRFPGESGTERPWKSYATNPLRLRQSARLVPEIRNWLGEKLPDYMVPSAFVLVDFMPLSPNGKVDRRALAQLEQGRQEGVPYVEPRTPTEEKLTTIWAEVLRLPRVGVDDNFFALGGHSLLATQAVSRIREVYRVDLPLRALFETPTVAGLAPQVEKLLGLEDGSEAVAFARVDRSGPLPLSFTQQRLWFLDQLDPLNPLYNVTSTIRLQGKLQVERLEDCLNEIVRRHEALRTRFGMANGEPVQIIEPWQRVTLANAQEEDRSEEEARHLAREEARQPFDLTIAPLLRARLIRIAENDHVLVVITHHIVSDGWSFTVLAEELAALYGGSTLPELPIQYADYAIWQRAFLAGERMEQQLAYWRKQLAGAPLVLELPTAPRPAMETFAGAKLSTHIPAELLDRLKELSQREGVTLFMTLLSAFGALLSRYSGQEEVLIGSPIAGRTRMEIEKLIGFFVNTLVFRSDMTGDPPVRELLRRTREMTTGAYANQDAPFEKLVEELKPERDLSRNPIFQVSLILQNLPPLTHRMGDLTVLPFPVNNPISKFDLTLMIAESSTGLRTTLEYNTALFEPATAARLLEHYANLLAGMVRHPEARVSKLALLSVAEREQVLFEWNATARDYRRDLCLHELIERQAALTPDKIAVKAGGLTMTYAELNARANQVAHWLVERGAGPDVLIGIRMARGVDMLAGLLGILKSGSAYVPLDPAFPQDRLDFILEDSNALLVLTDEAWERFDSRPTENLATQVRPEHLAYVLHTSGSTGKPKGVQITHGNVVNFLTSMRREPGLAADDTLLAVTTLSFDIAGLELYLPLVCGATVEIASREEAGDPALLMTALTRSGATVMQATPVTWRMLVEAGWTGDRNLKALCGGEALPPDLAVALLPRCGELWNMYGPTETTIWSSVYRVKSAPSGTVPLGRPIANTTMYVLDTHMRPVPVGVSGELYIGGESVARGYLNRPELTAERFLNDPFIPGARIYRTGDLVKFLPDGNLHYLGRADFQVKLRGFRIELGEIEAVLDRHPDVRQSVVVLREERLVAYVTAYVTAYVVGQVDAAALRLHARASLPDYMVPSAIVAIDEFPLTPNGKIDRKALPAPDFEPVSAIAPRTPAEELIAGIWARVLKLESVGVEDNFFELGGHSLAGTQVVSRIRETFHVDLPLRALFEAPTVAALALRVLALEQSSGATALTRAEHTGPAPLSFGQQRLWFLQQLDPLDSSYNMPYVRRLRGPLDIALFERSLGGIVQRHETLRTRFEIVNEEPVQVIDPWRQPALTLVSAQSEERARTLATEEARRPFNLQTGPLLRTTLIRIAPDDHVLVLNTHHIVSDGWSLGVIASELAGLYEGRALEALPLQYADYASWQRQYLSGERLQQELDWWQTQLAGAPRAIDLLTDHPRPAVATSRGEQISLTLPAALRDALLAIGREEGSTLFMTLLSAFSVFLARYSGQEEVVVGSPIAGRGHTGVEKLVGLFVNTVVLRTSLAGNPSFRKLLGNVRETTMGVYAHQDLPFEKLVQSIEVDRDLSRHPLFQVMLVLQNLPGLDQQLPGIAVSPFAIATGTSQFDLTLIVSERPEGLRLSLEYNVDLFLAKTAERMLGNFAILLESIAGHPESLISDLRLMGAAESTQIMEEFRGPALAYPRDLCVHQLFEAQVARTPDHVAVVFEGRRLTYLELNGRANQLAHYLRFRGVGRETPVAIFLDRSFETVIAIQAVLKAGGAYVPLDPGYPEQRIAHILEDAGARIVLTQQRLQEKLPPLSGEVILLDRDWTEIAGESSGNPTPLAGPMDLAYILFTSGSTGRPKGCQVEHRNLVHYLSWANANNFQHPDEGNYPLYASVAFDATATSLYLPLIRGKTIWVFPQQEEVAETLRKIFTAGPELDCVDLTPAHVTILKHLNLPASGIKLAVIGGEALDSHQVNVLRQLNPEMRIFNEYGPTETTVGCVGKQVLPADKRVFIGKPIANTSAYILDRYGNVAPIGAPGQIHISGPGVARGYSQRDELTREAFLPNPYREGERMYRTGDLGRWLPDGNIDFLGRADDQVKVRGFRIELGEIEAVLLNNPAVRDCAVIVREDEPGNRRLVAYIAPRQEGMPLPVAEIRKTLRKELPDYMVPAVFVSLPALPFTPSGKVDRKALPMPEPAGLGETGDTAPQTPTEEILAGIWAGVLALPSVGRDSNFFELGGHSLSATQVLLRARQAFQVELPLRDLFELPTVAGLAGAIDQLRRSGEGLVAPPLMRAPRDRPLPLSFAQQRLWFMAQLEPNDSIFNAPLAMRLKGDLDLAALELALNELVARHEVLRTTYRLENDQPVQVIADECKIALPVVEARDEAHAKFLIDTEGAKPFDLKRDPMLRALLVRLEEKHHVLSLCTHHIATDGWSNSILKRDLTAFYNVDRNSEHSDVHTFEHTKLQPLSIQYADYAVWQRGWLQGEVLEKQLAYWRNRLAGAPPVLALPTDRPRPALQTYTGAMEKSELPEETMQQVRDAGRKHGATSFMTMLAAFQILMLHYTRQTDIVLGTDVANRGDLQTEALIGFFVNLLPIRADLSGDPSFGDFLLSVREVTLGAYAHQDVPFDKLVEELQPERNPSHNLLVQVLFVQQNVPRGSLTMTGVEVGAFPVEVASKFDMAVFFSETPAGAVGNWVYNPDLFDASTIKRMGTLYRTVLEKAVENPGFRLSELLGELVEAQRSERSAEHKGFEAASLQKLKSIRRR